MQFRRARFLSSERTRYQGACLVSVAFSIMSRAREYSYHFSRDGRSIGTELPLAQRIFDAGLEAPFLLLVAHFEPVLDQDDPAVDDVFLDTGQSSRNRAVLLLGAEAHDVFDPGTVVPTAVENHDLAGRREVLHVPLNVHLGLLAVGGRGQRHEAEDARADALGDGANRAALSGAVAPLEHDDDPQAFVFHPVLKVAQLGLKPAQFLLVFFAFQFRAILVFLPLVFRHRVPPSPRIALPASDSLWRAEYTFNAIQRTALHVRHQTANIVQNQIPSLLTFYSLPIPMFPSGPRTAPPRSGTPPIGLTWYRGSGLPWNDVEGRVQGRIDPTTPRDCAFVVHRRQLEIERLPIGVQDQIKQESLLP